MKKMKKCVIQEKQIYFKQFILLKRKIKKRIPEHERDIRLSKGNIAIAQLNQKVNIKVDFKPSLSPPKKQPITSTKTQH